MQNRNLSLYQNLLKESYDQLPYTLQSLHNLAHGEHKTYHGHYTATVGPHIIAKLIAKLISLPNTGENLPLRVEFQQQDNYEHWHRHFNHKLFQSTQYQKENLLHEKVAFITLAFQIQANSKELSLKLQQMYLFKLPILQLCKFKVTGKEWEANGDFHFLVQVKAPIIGSIIQYQGTLKIQ